MEFGTEGSELKVEALEFEVGFRLWGLRSRTYCGAW